MNPSTPSITSRIPDAIRAPKALLKSEPQESRAIRCESSERLYHLEMRNYEVCVRWHYLIDRLITHNSARVEGRFHEAEQESCTENTEVTAWVRDES